MITCGLLMLIMFVVFMLPCARVVLGMVNFFFIPLLGIFS
jgi:hypothetical protein